MSILIRGMEMPKSCPCELLGIGYDLCCSFAGGIPARVKEYYECCQNGTRPSWCPLFPVPPHGRLIDADAFIGTIRPLCEEDKFAACTFETVKRLMVEHINNAPTIIPASEEEMK